MERGQTFSSSRIHHSNCTYLNDSSRSNRDGFSTTSFSNSSRFFILWFFVILRIWWFVSITYLMLTQRGRKKKRKTSFKAINVPEEVAANPISQHMLDRCKKPQRHPERWCGQSCTIIRDKCELEYRRRHLCPITVCLIAYQIANESFIEAVIEALRLRPNFEN